MGILELFGANRKERTNAFKRLAFDHDYTFVGDTDNSLIRLLSCFKLFKAGSSRTVENLIQKQDGMMQEKLSVFDYSYVVSTGKSTVKFNQTVFFVDSKMLQLPEFELNPETIIQKIKQWFGFRDIDFDAYPVFSDKYELEGENELFIRDSFDDKVLSFFTDFQGWNVHAVNYYLMFYKESKVVKNENLDQFLQDGLKIYDLFKTKDKEA